MSGIVILGMYHSGTTFLAKRLDELGVKMCGDRGYNVGEFTGLHYEDDEVVEKNYFEAKRGFVRDRRFVWNPSKDYVKWVMDYKRRREAEGVPWGVKEPRMALLSKVWLDKFRNCKLILCHRSPIRVSYTKVTKYKEDQHNPMNVQSTYSHTFATVLDNYNWLKGRKMPLFVFDYDANKNGHDRQNSALNKYLGFDFNYLEEWKFDT